MLKLTTFFGTAELTLFIMVLLLTVMTDVGRTGGVGVTGGPAAAAGAMGRPPKMTGTVLWLLESMGPVALVGVTGAAAVVVAVVAAAAAVL